MLKINLMKVFENTNNNCISVGTLDNKKLASIYKNCPYLENKIKSRTIIFWKERIEHIKKHLYENSEFSLEKMCELIPEILESPDYLGAREKDSSIQFIKKYSDNILVAVRVDGRGKLSFRTLYTITESQLQDYIKKGKAWEFGVDK